MKNSLYNNKKNKNQIIISLTFTVCDMLHKGHILHFLKARKALSESFNVSPYNIYLICGLATQYHVEVYKTKEVYFCNEEKRKKELSETGLVDYIFLQDGSHYVRKYILEIESLFNSNIKAIVAGFDQVRDNQLFTEALKELEKEFKYIRIIILENRESDVISPLKPSTSWLYKHLSPTSLNERVNELRRFMNKTTCLTWKNIIEIIDLCSNKKYNIKNVELFSKKFYICIFDRKELNYIFLRYNLETPKIIFANDNKKSKRNNSI